MERHGVTGRDDFATDSRGAEASLPRNGAGVFRRATAPSMWGIEEARRLPRIAVLGAGHVGPVIARVAVAAGYSVTIAASGEPERIALITRVLAPGAEPRRAADAVDDSDVVVLAIPVHKFAAFDSALVAGKLVVDAMNYWPLVDGVQEMFVRTGPARRSRIDQRHPTPKFTPCKETRRDHSTFRSGRRFRK
jgi:hypothetical protein